MRDALRHLRDSITVPPVDPARERALLEAFDARDRQPARVTRRSRSLWLAAAAAVMLAASAMVWIAARVAPAPVAPSAAPELTGFVPWPGADALPPFESGDLRRVELPVTALPMLGLPDPPRPTAIVEAEVLVGLDGFARAVRLVNEEGDSQ